MQSFISTFIALYQSVDLQFPFDLCFHLSTFRSFSVSFLLIISYDVHAVLPTATSILPFFLFLFSSFDLWFDVLWFVDVVGSESRPMIYVCLGRMGRLGRLDEE